MEAEKSQTRLKVFVGMLVLALVALSYRLVDLQWVRHEEFQAKAEQQHEHEFFREAPRGDIRDRRGNLLATSVPVKTVFADPALLKGREAEMATVLAPLLKTNAVALMPLLSRFWRTHRGAVLTNHYVVLKRQVSIDDWEKIQGALGQQFTNAVAGKLLTPKARQEQSFFWMRSILADPDQLRVYPNHELASHIVGYTGFSTSMVNGVVQSFARGREGIEATFDEKLHGTRGWVRTEYDGKRREIFVFREQDVESRPGLNVVLTIDARIQQIAEEELRRIMTNHFAKSGSAIVMRPKTGEILAMANLPTFNPNFAGRAPADTRRNRLIVDPFEPGSTFKTVTMAAAFNDGQVKLTDMFDCENGAFSFAGKILHDHEHYGVMSVQQIIAKSSNIGTAKVAINMGQQRFYKYITEFGFGKRTGLPLTGENPGEVPPLNNWKKIHISRIPIGHGVTATSLQTVMAMAAVANGGLLMRPLIVDSLVDSTGEVVAKYPPQVVRRVIEQKAAKTTVEALKTVVAEKGTAEKAMLEHYTVAGKTGTAQKVVNGQYSHEKYFVSFLGFFPADDPELLIFVCADEPLKRTGYYGGVVCAPVFKRIAERSANFLNIKPDIIPDSTNDVLSGTRWANPNVLQVRGKL